MKSNGPPARPKRLEEGWSPFALKGRDKTAQGKAQAAALSFALSLALSFALKGRDNTAQGKAQAAALG
jgi:hypothetical protein